MIIDYDALSALIPGLEVIHEDGHLIYSRDAPGGHSVEVEQCDGMAVVFLRHWSDAPRWLDGQTERGRFPADATEAIAECMRQAEQEYRS